MNLRTSRQQQWRKWVSWLVMISMIASLPATLFTPAPTHAESAEIEQFGPSSYLPLLRNNYCSGTRPTTNPFGVQTYGNTGHPDPDFSVLQDSRSHWLRNSIEWRQVEPTNRAPAQYVWTNADRALRAASDNCVNMIVTLDITPDWATTGDGRSPFQTDLLPEFVEFVTAVVERYDGDGVNDAPGNIVVKHWEFYNEPDAGPAPTGGGWGEFGTRYAEMLKAVYPAVKAADPEAQVVFGGLAYDSFTDSAFVGPFIRDFFDNVLDADAGPYFDIMNVHYYPFSRHRREWTQTDSSGLVEKIGVIRSKLAERGLNKPLFITEIGWHSNNIASNPSNEDFQARHVVQLFTQSVAVGADVAIWWPLVDLGDYQFKSGLASDSDTYKFAHKVYLEALKRIGEGAYVRQVVVPTVNNDLEVYEFREPLTNRVQYIAWLNPIAPFNAEAVATFDDSVTTTWETDGSRATVYYQDGVVKQVVQDGDDGSNDGKLRITVGRSPIYIVLN
jgi:hypothetical protein